MEIILAASPSGIAVLHVYGPDSRIVENTTGALQEVKDYAAQRYPGVPVKEITQ